LANGAGAENAAPCTRLKAPAAALAAKWARALAPKSPAMPEPAPSSTSVAAFVRTSAPLTWSVPFTR
jgi:hypothetical protein